MLSSGNSTLSALLSATLSGAGRFTVMARILAPAALAAWALACSTASAATVTSTWQPQPGVRLQDRASDDLTVTAAPGEQNRLIVTLAGEIVLSDPAGLTTSAPCVSQDAYTVHCPL